MHPRVDHWTREYGQDEGAVSALDRRAVLAYFWFGVPHRREAYIWGVGTWTASDAHIHTYSRSRLPSPECNPPHARHKVWTYVIDAYRHIYEQTCRHSHSQQPPPRPIAAFKMLA